MQVLHTHVRAYDNIYCRSSLANLYCCLMLLVFMRSFRRLSAFLRCRFMAQHYTYVGLSVFVNSVRALDPFSTVASPKYHQTLLANIFVFIVILRLLFISVWFYRYFYCWYGEGMIQRIYL